MKTALFLSIILLSTDLANASADQEPLFDRGQFPARSFEELREIHGETTIDITSHYIPRSPLPSHPRVEAILSLMNPELRNIFTENVYALIKDDMNDYAKLDILEALFNVYSSIDAEKCQLLSPETDLSSRNTEEVRAAYEFFAAEFQNYVDGQSFLAKVMLFYLRVDFILSQIDPDDIYLQRIFVEMGHILFYGEHTLSRAEILYLICEDIFELDEKSICLYPIFQHLTPKSHAAEYLSDPLCLFKLRISTKPAFTLDDLTEFFVDDFINYANNEFEMRFGQARHKSTVTAPSEVHKFYKKLFYSYVGELDSPKNDIYKPIKRWLKIEMLLSKKLGGHIASGRTKEIDIIHKMINELEELSYFWHAVLEQTFGHTYRDNSLSIALAFISELNNPSITKVWLSNSLGKAHLILSRNQTKESLDAARELIILSLLEVFKNFEIEGYAGHIQNKGLLKAFDNPAIAQRYAEIEKMAHPSAKKPAPPIISINDTDAIDLKFERNGKKAASELTDITIREVASDQEQLPTPIRKKKGCVIS